MSQLTEYRCTRTSLYKHDCGGRDNLSARQGHYVVACCRDHALLAMAERFPGDPGFFTVDVAKEAAWCGALCEYCSAEVTL